MPDHFAAVLARFPNARRSGDEHVARCPCHDDSTASLGIRRGDTGKVLLRCRAGCALDDVLAAVGLMRADLRRDESGGGAPSFVDQRIPCGSVDLFAGKPKAGKSTAARVLALKVARGGAWLGFACLPRPVWYLVLEDKRSEVRRHFRQARPATSRFASCSASRRRISSRASTRWRRASSRA